MAAPVRLTIALLGVEVFSIELGTPPPYVPPEHHPDLTSVNRHSGDFGFAGEPRLPYWTSEPGESPHVP